MPVAIRTRIPSTITGILLNGRAVNGRLDYSFDTRLVSSTITLSLTSDSMSES